MTPSTDGEAAVEYIGVIATQALKGLERPPFFAFWAKRRSRAEVKDALSKLVTLASDVDPRDDSEELIAEVTAKLTLVISALENDFAHKSHPEDAAECQFLGVTLARLKDARKWIAQGLSPNPAKRPSDDARKAAAGARANEVWADLFA
jgi:hypothetical protein